MKISVSLRYSAFAFQLFFHAFCCMVLVATGYQAAAQQEEISGHRGSVEAVAVAPNGKTLLTGSMDGTARLWDIANGRVLRVVPAHPGGVLNVAFAPDGRAFLTSGRNGMVALWDTVTGQELRQFSGHKGNVRCLAIAFDGKTLLSGGDDRTARLWDVSTGRQLRRLAHRSAVQCGAFAPDGRHVITGGQDGLVRSWQTRTGRATGEVRLSSGLESVNFSPDGKMVVVASERSKTAYVLDFATGDEIRRLAHDNEVRQACFSSNGQQILTASLDKTARLWDLATGRELRRFGGQSEGLLTAAFSPDSRFVFAGSSDKTARLWDAITGSELRIFDGSTEPSDGPQLVLQTGHADTCTALALSPDERYVASGGVDGWIRLWDAQSGMEIRQYPPTSNTSVTQSIHFTPDGRFVLVGGGTARLLEVANGRMARRYEDAGVTWSALSPDGRLVAVAVGRQVHLMTVNGGYSPSPAEFLSDVRFVRFSSDSRQLAVLTNDKSALLMEADTGRELFRLSDIALGHNEYVPFDFSPDAKYIAATRTDKSLVLFDARSGTEIRRSKARKDQPIQITFSTDGRTLAVENDWGKGEMWDVATLASSKNASFNVAQAQFTKDGKAIISRDNWRFTKYDLVSGRQLRHFSTPSSLIREVFFSTDNRLMAVWDENTPAALWDLSVGRPTRHSGKPVRASALSKDGALWALREEREVRVLNATNGVEIAHWPAPKDAGKMLFQPDGKSLFITSGREIVLVATTTGQELKRFSDHTNDVARLRCDSAGKYLISYSPFPDNRALVWDVETGKMVREFAVEVPTDIYFGGINGACISPDGAIVVISRGTEVKAFDRLTGAELYNVRSGISVNWTLAISSDGHYIMTAGWGHEVIIWELKTGRLVRRLPIGYRVPMVDFTSDGRAVIGSEDARVSFWDVSSGIRLGNFVQFRDGGWAAVDEAGRYDSSRESGVLGMHWLIGIVPIGLEQFKDGYFEPNLLAKKLGFNKEPLRNVPSLSGLKLFPEAAIAPIADGKMATINLTNQDGGIGSVQVFINDKEYVVDARPRNFDETAKTATLTVNLHTPLVKPGQSNRLRVVTRNSEGTLASRPVEALWTAPGQKQERQPQLYAIVAGISNYANSKEIRNLKFAAKDARDMARALRLGGTKLFGANGLHLQLFTGERKPKNDMPRREATKTQLKQAFELVAEQAKPEDIVLVYLAGHGTTLGLGSSTYVYLTQDANNSDVAGAPDREKWTISSEELAEWAKKIPAQKQVMMLDTCAAGAAAEDLLARRDLSGDAIRAIERLKDRTGFHVLMGAAANKESYEAGRYKQGLLTYALLEGMKGQALREQQYVDVRKLFSYAQERVPQLAKNIGGVQQPQVSAPRGETFDVAMVTQTERKAIPLSTEQPQVLRPVVFDEKAEDNDDTLKLLPPLREALNELDSQDEAGLVYLDYGKLPGAVQPMCSYRVNGDVVRVKIDLQKDGKTEGQVLTVEGKKDQPALLVQQMVQSIRRTLTRKANLPITDVPTTAVPAKQPFSAVPPRAMPKKQPTLTPQTGEIALRGSVVSVNIKAGQLMLKVRSFMLPNGRQSNIAPKPKAIFINKQTTWRGVTFKALKAGANIEVIGADQGSGKELSARFVMAR